MDDDLFRGGKIHIRIQPNPRKRSYLTTIEGLETDLDLQSIAGALRKMCNCGVRVLKDVITKKEVIRLQDDHRDTVMLFLTSEKICQKEQIVKHGF